MKSIEEALSSGSHSQATLEIGIDLNGDGVILRGRLVFPQAQLSSVWILLSFLLWSTPAPSRLRTLRWRGSRIILR